MPSTSILSRGVQSPWKYSLQLPIQEVQCKHGGSCQEKHRSTAWDLWPSRGNETFTWKRIVNQGVTQPVPLDDTKEESNSNKQFQSCASVEHVDGAIFSFPLLANGDRPSKFPFKGLPWAWRTKVFSRQGEDIIWPESSPSRKFPCKTQTLNQLFAFLISKGDTKRERERETWEQQAASLEGNYKHNSKRAAEFLCKTWYKAWQFSNGKNKITQSKFTTHSKLSSSSNSECTQ